MPRVTLCASVYNQSEFVKGMLDSVVAQTMEDWELIFVDDGSTEDIHRIVASYDDKRIRYHAFTRNQGHLAGFNYAFSVAALSGSPYWQPISADERISPDKLAWQCAYLDERKDIDALWGLPLGNLEFGLRPLWEQYALKAHNRSNEAWIRTLLNLESIPLGGISMLCRREVLEDLGGYDDRLKRCADLEWFVRFFQKYRGIVLPYRWGISVPNPGSVSNTATAEEFMQELLALRAKHETPRPISSGTVTVAIPVKNMERWIEGAIRCALAQTYPDIRVFVWNDGSTDGTLERARMVGDARVAVFDSKESLGTEGAINQLLARCDTPFFCILCADDLLEPDMVEKCMAQFKANPWLEFVSTQTDFIDENAAPYAAEHPFKNIMRATNKTREEWLRHLYYGNHYFGVGIYRTDVVRSVGGWDGTVGCLGDYEMYLQLLQRENIHVIEENLTHTRIHGENRSLLSPADQVKLKHDYHRIKSRYYAPRMKVVIATPFYEMRGFSPYIFSMTHTIRILTQLGIEHEFWELSGDSYVDRAKNTIMNKFLEDPANTDLFMIDSDMHWNPDAVLKMLALPEEIVVGSYPQKNGWDKWTSSPVLKPDANDPARMHPVGRQLDDGSALIVAEYLAGGFMRIKRSALERFREHYKDLVYYDPSSDPNCPDRLYTEFSSCERGMMDGRPVRFGEDRVFGRRLKEMGIECFIYPNIDFGHYGIKAWTGNFDKFLRGRKDEVGQSAGVIRTV